MDFFKKIDDKKKIEDKDFIFIFFYFLNFRRSLLSFPLFFIF
jgi:hypothetical protein